MSRGWSSWLIAVLFVTLLVPAPASAEVYPVDMLGGGAMTVAQEMVDQWGLVTGAAYLSGGVLTTGDYGAGTPSAWADDTVTASFTFTGTGFGIISSGGADRADYPNVSPSTTGSTGTTYRGANDATVISIVMRVPAEHNCLAMSFQFLSDEYPEYVGSPFNDGFIAELDNHTWTTAGGTIVAPDNFALDPNDNMMSINSPVGFSATNSVDSTYDGASKMLTAYTTALPGDHVLYLSIFDASDWAYDSTIFIDNIHTFFNKDPEIDDCPFEFEPPPPPPPPPTCEDDPTMDHCFIEPIKTFGRPYEHKYYPRGVLPVDVLPVVSGGHAYSNTPLSTDATRSDSDRDGISDATDLCLGIAGGAGDLDGDGRGDDCDIDMDGDGMENEVDACPTDPDPMCDVTHEPHDVRGGSDAARGSFAHADAIEAKPGQVEVRSEESLAGMPPALALLGVAIVLLLAFAARKRR